MMWCSMMCFFTAEENVGVVSSGTSASRHRNGFSVWNVLDKTGDPTPPSVQGIEAKERASIRRQPVTSTRSLKTQRKSAPSSGVNTAATTKSQLKRRLPKQFYIPGAVSAYRRAVDGVHPGAVLISQGVRRSSRRECCAGRQTRPTTDGSTEYW